MGSGGVGWFLSAVSESFWCVQELAGMPETTMGSYWPKINRLTQYVVRKRIVTEAERDAGAAANEEHPRSHGPELEQPYDQIINSTDYLELINAIEHGHVSLRLTAQGAVHFLV